MADLEGELSDSGRPVPRSRESRPPLSQSGDSPTGGLILVTLVETLLKALTSRRFWGAVLLAAGGKGKRFALPHSRIMIHQPLGGASGQATDIEIQTREILRLKKDLISILAKHTGQTEERIQKDGERDYFMSAAEAKAYGLINDEVYEKRPAEPKKT